ncbi:MAG: phospho-N-acetylmuramoyl-pentapeptide-transferase, partial [Candidatus Babeliales bacterium]
MNMLPALGMVIIAAMTTIGFGYPFLWVANRFFCSQVRGYTPAEHAKKNGTPTFGGLLIIGMALVNGIAWIGVHSAYFWIIAIIALGFGCLGAWDDWQKIRRKQGISARSKLGAQIFIALAVIGLWLYFCNPAKTLWIPYIDVAFSIGWWIIPWAVLVVIACANGVNITDGLDGLASWCLIPNFMLYMVIGGPLIPVVSSMSAIMAGVLLGFLWFNSYPAQIFMGDTGSLALGSVLAMIALMLHAELLLLISGFILIIEVMSVILQIGSYKLRKKRLFKMAPLHHHFELSGVAEPKIVMRAGIL